MGTYSLSRRASSDTRAKERDPTAACTGGMSALSCPLEAEPVERAELDN